MPNWQKILFASSIVPPPATIPGFLVVGSATSPYMTVYDSNVNKVTQTWTTPMSGLFCVSISRDKRWIALGGSVSPFLQIYDCITGVPVLVTGLTFSGLTSVLGVEFTQDNSKLLVLNSTSTYMQCLDVGTWTATPGFTSPAPANAPQQLTVNPNGSAYGLAYVATPWLVEYDLMTGVSTGINGGTSVLYRGTHYNTLDTPGSNWHMAHPNTPNVVIRNASTGAAGLSVPGTFAGNPAAAQHCVEVNEDGTAFFDPGGLSFYRIWTRSGTTLTGRALAFSPPNPYTAAAWSRDGTKLHVLMPASSLLHTYNVNLGGTNWVKDANNSNMPPGAGKCIACSW
jgi:hypothetical protein